MPLVRISLPQTLPVILLGSAPRRTQSCPRLLPANLLAGEGGREREGGERGREKGRGEGGEGRREGGREGRRLEGAIEGEHCHASVYYS